MRNFDSSDQSTTATSAFSSSLITNKNEELSFLRKNPLKRAINALFSVFSYVYSVLPIQHILYTIIFSYRCLQLLSASFFFNYDKLYPKDSKTYPVAVFLSIFNRIVPISSDINAERTLGWIYVALILVYFFFLIIISQVFINKSTISMWVPKVLSYTIEIIDICAHPPALAAAASLIAYDDKTTADIALVVLIFVCFVLDTSIMVYTNLATIIFYPSSIPLMFQWGNSVLMVLSAAASFCSEIVGKTTSDTLRKTLFIIVPILYLVGCLIIAIFCIVMTLKKRFVIQSVLFTSAINSAIACVLMFMDKEMPDYVLTFPIICLLLFYVLNYLSSNILANKSLKVLDELEDNPEDLTLFKNLTSLYQYITSGFMYSHRYVVSYSIFRDLMSLYPDNIGLIIMYSKFLVIYPEESSQLTWIYNHLRKTENKSMIMQFVELQIQTILMRRESTLSASLKKKLTAVTTLSNTAKLRMRNTWETILSGNMADLDPLFAAAYRTISQLDTKFSYILNYHSNNQYAIMAYANYQREILANYSESEALKEKVKAIQAGHSEEVDQVYLFGRVIFPSLPLHSMHQLSKDSRLPAIQVEDQLPGNDLALFDQDSEIEMQTRIRMSVEKMHLPSIQWTIVINIICYLIFIIFPMIIGYCLIEFIQVNVTKPADLVSTISKLQFDIITMTSLTSRLLGERMAGFTEACSPEYAKNENVSRNIGGSCSTFDQLIYFANDAMLVLHELGYSKSNHYDHPEFKEAAEILFEDKTPFYIYTTPVNYTVANRSIQQILVNTVQTAIVLSTFNDPLLLYSRHVATFMSNFNVYLPKLDETSKLMTDFLYKQTATIVRNCKITLVVFLFSFQIIFITLMIVTYKWVTSQKRKVFSCFHSLPKTVLSKMIEKVTSKSINDDEEDSEKTAGNADTDQQHLEEKTIAVLRSGEMSGGSSIIIMFVVYTIFLLAVMDVMFYYIYDFYSEGASMFDYSTPQLATISTAYCDLMNVLLSLNIVSLVDITGINLGYTRDTIIQMFANYPVEALDQFKVFLFGNSSDNMIPISSFIDKGFDSKLRMNPKCNWNEAKSEHDIITCADGSSMFIRVVNIIERVLTLDINATGGLKADNEAVMLAWHLTLTHLFAEHIYPSFSHVDDTIKTIFTSSYSSMVTSSTICSILGFIAVVWYIIVLYKMSTALKTIMNFILHAPASVILGSDYIMSIISSDFSTNERTGQVVDSDAYREVAQKFPDGIAKIGNNDKIAWKNEIATQFFGDSIEVPDDVKFNISRANYKKEFPLSCGDKKTVCFVDHINGENYLIMKDNTSKNDLEMEYNKEKENHKELIRKMLPEKMADIYFAENSISAFTVQTATCVVISFTEITKDQLITMYGRLQDSLSKYSTISNIDIVGDEFVICAGLFEKVNQAEKHSNDAITFAIDSLELIKELSTEESKIVAKIGAATGGPLNVGIINSARPYFEICGDTIDIANEMSATAPPNVVHTTRSIYELIYGGNFAIKERGEVSLGKFGSAVTYLISSEK